MLKCEKWPLYSSSVKHCSDNGMKIGMFESHTLGYVCLHMRLLHTFSDYVWMVINHLSICPALWVSGIGMSSHGCMICFNLIPRLKNIAWYTLFTHAHNFL